MNPLAKEGSICLLKHRGTMPSTTWNGEPPTKTVNGIPFVGSVGTNDPSIWTCALWIDGKFWKAELKSDFRLDTPPSHHELRSHLQEHEFKPNSPWKPILPAWI